MIGQLRSCDFIMWGLSIHF